MTDASGDAPFEVDPPNSVQPWKRTLRQKRNTAALKDAARIVFARDGFHEARIVDVASLAQVGVGTFYRYFDSKATLLAAVLTDVIDSIYESGIRRAHDPQDPIGQIAEANKRFFDLYQENAALLSLLEQLAPTDEVFRDIFLTVRRREVTRQKQNWDRLKQEGLIDETLDTEVVAGALVAMTNAQAHIWFNLKEPFDPERDLPAFNVVWANALGLRRD
ncbi:TetR/AcrR family transcriptional regulator [Specibacter sp. RAF43]|uniref:TetR/AcrR family transcriptional regulator n=1 Tax=Specibacter sp. RAF43 TaxID=3233057 RepID=UPI003F9E5CBE